ncbi:hypothetical protein EVAR_6267_1 [Eumeta japonica]|uniref:Uncharacterized protein n=1 Tax=Eumeta variegata TaxID=151549 RepID=A0A4C1T995_EUMVA|nr:hypothetical protein EVAR_6267_1 [Eumeta japonica]
MNAPFVARRPPPARCDVTSRISAVGGRPTAPPIGDRLSFICYQTEATISRPRRAPAGEARTNSTFINYQPHYRLLSNLTQFLLSGYLAARDGRRARALASDLSASTAHPGDNYGFAFLHSTLSRSFITSRPSISGPTRVYRKISYRYFRILTFFSIAERLRPGAYADVSGRMIPGSRTTHSRRHVVGGGFQCRAGIVMYASSITHASLHVGVIGNLARVPRGSRASTGLINPPWRRQS